jgi:tryptophan 2,3-dioxygenase
VATTTYCGYLRLPELLSLQRPLAPREVSARERAAEHFFIVSHQATELWLSQALLDLDAAVDALAPPGLQAELAVEHVQRVTEVAGLLLDHVAILRRLPIACFAPLRARLGHASGAESAQFRALERALGIRDGPGPVYEALCEALDARGLCLADLYADDLAAGALYRVAETLLDVAERLLRWQLLHVQVVARLLGDQPGTGGTTGVAYLVDRVRIAFPELWEARVRAHECPASAS